jgi:hypothetical protein
MIPRSTSSSSGWPSDSGIDGSALQTGEENDKEWSHSRPGSETSGSVSSGQSKHRPDEIGTPSRAPGREGRQISPDEILGEAPAVPTNSPVTESVLLGTEDKYADLTVRPMGFRNGDAPQYAALICYRNAVITMLLNLPYFANWVTGGYPSLREENAPRTALDNMQKLAEIYWSQPTSFGNSVSTSQVIDVKAKQKRLDAEMHVLWTDFIAANPTFTVIPTMTNCYLQEDAGEFLMTLFNSIDLMLEFR